jgi:hypothetical protein
MKYFVSMIFLIFTILVSSLSFGQISVDKEIFRFDPIDIGNKWIYTPNLYKHVVKDTILANQKTFRQIEREYISTISTFVEYDYERIDSATGDIYAWGNDSIEYIMDNLNHNPGDTINASRFFRYGTTIFDSLRTLDLFGMPIETRVYSTEPNPFFFDKYYLSKDFGMSYLHEEFEAVLLNYNLKGAVIKGIAYGDTSTVTGINGREPVQPMKFVLMQNYPNPFNPETTIKYSIPQAGDVKLTIYNELGIKIATIVNEYKHSGSYTIKFNGYNLASGIYFYRLESGNYSAVKKFVLMK